MSQSKTGKKKILRVEIKNLQREYEKINSKIEQLEIIRSKLSNGEFTIYIKVKNNMQIFI